VGRGGGGGVKAWCGEARRGRKELRGLVDREVEVRRPPVHAEGGQPPAAATRSPMNDGGAVIHQKVFVVPGVR